MTRKYFLSPLKVMFEVRRTRKYVDFVFIPHANRVFGTRLHNYFYERTYLSIPTDNNRSRPSFDNHLFHGDDIRRRQIMRTVTIKYVVLTACSYYY